jgi:hypothetical protein
LPQRVLVVEDGILNGQIISGAMVTKFTIALGKQANTMRLWFTNNQTKGENTSHDALLCHAGMRALGENCIVKQWSNNEVFWVFWYLVKVRHLQDTSMEEVIMTE